MKLITKQIIKALPQLGAIARCEAEDDNAAAIHVNDANARLIAAAPELLAAVQLFCDLDTIAPLAGRDRFNEAVQVAVVKARAALAKAQS